MKVKMIFNLPEERDEWLHAAHGSEYRDALFDFDQALRNNIKYHPEKPLTPQEIRDMLYEMLQDIPWQE